MSWRLLAVEKMCGEAVERDNNRASPSNSNMTRLKSDWSHLATRFKLEVRLHCLHDSIHQSLIPHVQVHPHSCITQKSSPFSNSTTPAQRRDREHDISKHTTAMETTNGILPHNDHDYYAHGDSSHGQPPNPQGRRRRRHPGSVGRGSYGGGGNLRMCPHCGRTFKRTEHLERHVRTRE